METKVLAHIERISKLSPIVDKKGDLKNNLCASILGWQVMVKPTDFNVGDLVVYVEVGSILPATEQFSFMEKYSYRVKTQSYFGGSFISEGLILPLSSIGETNAKGEKYVWEVGTDVTDRLGITKYYTKEEQEENDAENIVAAKYHWTKKYIATKWLWRHKWFRTFINGKKQQNDWPKWIAKTDEPKIENNDGWVTEFADKNVYITEKIDFQSVTFTGQIIPKFPILNFINNSKIFWKKREHCNFIVKFLNDVLFKYQFIVCSRNQITNDKGSLYHQIATKYKIEQILQKNPHLTIQGEQGNGKVQGNKYKITEPTLWVFNIFDHVRKYHYTEDEMVDFCGKYNLIFVPIIKKCKLSEIGTTVQELVQFSKGNSVLYPTPREGVVIRCIENGKKLLSFKVINPDFKLKHNL